MAERKELDVTGVLRDYAETGTGGAYWVLWADEVLYPDLPMGYDREVMIEQGDHLTIYHEDGSVRWDGVIDKDGEAGWVNFRDNKPRSELPDELFEPLVWPEPPEGHDERAEAHEAWEAEQERLRIERDGPDQDEHEAMVEALAARGITWTNPLTLTPEVVEVIFANGDRRRAVKVAREADYRARSPHWTTEDRAYLDADDATTDRMYARNGQQASCGRWVHWIQRGWDPDEWGTLFFHDPPLRARLVRGVRSP